MVLKMNTVAIQTFVMVIQINWQRSVKQTNVKTPGLFVLLDYRKFEVIMLKNIDKNSLTTEVKFFPSKVNLKKKS